MTALGNPAPRRVINLLVITLTVAAGAVDVGQLEGAWRPIFTLLAALLAPGLALMSLMRPTDLLHTAGVAVGLSLAIDVAASLAMVWTGWWHPGPVAVAIGTVSICMLGRNLARSRDPRPDASR